MSYHWLINEILFPINDFFQDQVLFSMQKKLDNLFEQLSFFKDQPEVEAITTMESGCKLKHHSLTPHDSLVKSFTLMVCVLHLIMWYSFFDKRLIAFTLLVKSLVKFNTSAKGSNGDEEFKYKLPISNEAEPDERRMSDLSDWAPSVISSVDIEVYTWAFKSTLRVRSDLLIFLRASLAVGQFITRTWYRRLEERMRGKGCYHQGTVYLSSVIWSPEFKGHLHFPLVSLVFIPSFTIFYNNFSNFCRGLWSWKTSFVVRIWSSTSSGKTL